MITLIASIVGFIGSVIPEIIKIFKLHKEQNYQLSILDKQIELKKTELECSQNSTTKISDVLADFETTYQTPVNNNDTMDILNSTVRPIIAYGFFAIYIMVKYAQYISLEMHNITSCTTEVLWAEDDKAAFASIISFYFGQRMFKVKK